MTGSAPTAKVYRDHATILREVAKEKWAPENKAPLLLNADNYDRRAGSIESVTTARKMQRAFGDHLPESGGRAEQQE